MITGIIVALAAELSTLTDQKMKKGDCIFINDHTLLVFSGAGSENARNASQLLIKKGAERLISWGCAAALKTNLNPGDLILPQTLTTEDQEQLSLSTPWFHYVLENLTSFTAYTGPLTESSVIVTESAAKKALHRKNRAIALDMESIAVAKIAIEQNIPVLVIRSIVDPIEMDLPKAVSFSLDDQGEVVLIKLLWFLLTHPTELPGLITLGMHFNAAKNKLKLVAKHLDIIVGFEQNSINK